MKKDAAWWRAYRERRARREGREFRPPDRRLPFIPDDVAQRLGVFPEPMSELNLRSVANLSEESRLAMQLLHLLFPEWRPHDPNHRSRT